MENYYGFWSHKYDFAEINRYNWRLVMKDIFYLDIKKISLLSMLFAVEIFLTIFSKYAFGAIPIANFFTMEISFVGIMFIYISSNFIYASIFCAAANSLRIVLPFGSDPIGVLAMTLSDVSFLAFFAIFFFLLKKYWLFKVESDNQIKYYIAIIAVCGFVASFMSAFTSLVLNDLFIFEWYKNVWPDTGKIIGDKGSATWISLLFIAFGVSLLKFAANLIIICLSIKTLVYLINKHLF
ncbi:ECF transporter S component [Spiroplasma endosymbiont of Diplazon laetatorius]|uniref:ECF transporter S component n=1 Tax=Spiroplasma endosymbiont of Diplazon laetatorius TaxID=3066322 RepID=UPI0030D11B26